MRILLVGCGKMGSALLRRWEELNLYNDICIVEPFEAKTTAQRVERFEDIPEDFKPDLVIFAVKPQILSEIIAPYKKYADACVLSIAAGTNISFYQNYLGDDVKVIRSMPNTPAAIGKGMTVAVANAHVSNDEKDMAEKLLSAVGKFIWVEDEDVLNPVTALSGSGPAYVFLLIETMTKAGIKIGLDADMAAALARQTVIGAAALAETDADTPASVLRENVTSPGGTTAAALDVLMSDELQDIFDKALEAATVRARQLSD